MRASTWTAPDSDRLPTLLLQAKSGDRDAAEELFRLLTPWIFFLARQRVRHAADAEEITQEVLLRLWLKLPTFDPAKSSGRPWLRRILANLISDHCGRRSRSQPLHFDLASTRDDPLTIAEGNDTLAQLEKALVDLEPDQRTALRLRYLEELNFKQLAGAANVSLNTVAGRVYRGLAKLRSSMRRVA